MVLLVEFAVAAALMFAMVVLLLFRDACLEVSYDPPPLDDALDRVARC